MNAAFDDIVLVPAWTMYIKNIVQILSNTPSRWPSYDVYEVSASGSRPRCRNKVLRHAERFFPLPE
jgi:hypothetical protein